MAIAAYEVLARKYRPGKLSELIGQDVLVRTLTNAIAQNRIPHAFIMTGIRGVGKTSTARIIAKSLVCIGEDGKGTQPTATPCGVCEHCRSIAEDRHVDIMEMDAASRTGVNDIRELIESVQYHPVSARYKIYIIDEVHMLSKSAFNALLKTLEEPPPHIKFVFATTEIRKIPVTILSRCMRFDLPRVEVETLSAHFAKVAANEGASIEPDALTVIAHAAEGSVRDGLSLLDQAINSVPKGELVTRDHVSTMLGLVGRGRVFTLFQSIVEGNPREAIEAMRGLYQQGAEPAMVLQDMLELAHFITQLKVIPELAEAEHIPQADREQGKVLAEKLSFPFLARAWQMLLKGIQEVRQAPSALMAAEMVLVRLAYVSELPPPGDLVKDLKKNSSASGVGGTLAPQAVRQAEPVAQQRPTQEVSAANPRDFNDLINLFNAKQEYAIASQLKEIVVVAFDAEARKLEFSPAPATPANLAGRVGECLSGWTGNRWVAVVSAAKPEGASLRQVTEAAEAKRREDAIRDATVQAVLAEFTGAKITGFHEMASEVKLKEQHQ